MLRFDHLLKRYEIYATLKSKTCDQMINKSCYGNSLAKHHVALMTYIQDQYLKLNAVHDKNIIILFLNSILIFKSKCHLLLVNSIIDKESEGRTEFDHQQR